MKLAPVPPPRILRREDMLPYQVDMARFMVRHRYAAIWALMGAGKTVATLTALAHLLKHLEAVSALIIAPLRVANTVWAQEGQKWEHLRHLKFAIATGSEDDRRIAVNSNADIVVINRENVEWLTDYYGGLWPFDTVVIDEASSFRNHDSKRWKAMRSVRKHIRTLYELTGTPAPKGYINLWAQMFLLDRGARLGKAITQYRSKYFDLDYAGHNYILKDGMQEVIQDKLKDVVLVVESYAGLPELVIRRVPIKFDKKLMKKYRDFERDCILEIGDAEIDAVNAGALSNKLRQFAQGAVYDDEKKWHHVHDYKIEALRDIVDEFQGKPILVAYEFKSDLERLKKAFPNAVVLDKKGACIPDWNAGKIDMLLAHPASAGHGLNLQESTNVMVFFGLPWDLELYDQFIARLRRTGQKASSVIALHILAEGTEDESVMKTLETRGRTQRDLVEAVKRKVEEYRKSLAA